jgi:hypothetical protein
VINCLSYAAFNWEQFSKRNVSVVKGTLFGLKLFKTFLEWFQA